MTDALNRRQPAHSPRKIKGLSAVGGHFYTEQLWIFREAFARGLFEPRCSFDMLMSGVDDIRGRLGVAYRALGCPLLVAYFILSYFSLLRRDARALSLTVSPYRNARSPIIADERH